MLLLNIVTQCQFNVGPASAMSADHLSSIGAMYRVCWEQTFFGMLTLW